MDVSIIIVNYNTSRLINDCIESIFRLVTDIEYEIIIVDNNTENLTETITVHNDTRIKLLQLSENVGFGRANNAGVKIAKGRNLFFLNPDTILLNNAVKILSDYLDSNPHCGACGGNLFDSKMNPIHSYRMLMPGILDAIDISMGRRLSKIIFGKNHEFNYTGKTYRVGYITGADLIIPHKLFNDVGGFDNKIFMYYEETDLCKKISLRGYSIISVPISKIIHLVGQSHGNQSVKTHLNTIPYVFEGKSRRIYYKNNTNILIEYISRAILKCNFGLRYLFKLCDNNSRIIEKTRFINA